MFPALPLGKLRLNIGPSIMAVLAEVFGPIPGICLMPVGVGASNHALGTPPTPPERLRVFTLGAPHQSPHPVGQKSQ